MTTQQRIERIAEHYAFREGEKSRIIAALTAFAEEEADNLLQGFVLRERADKDGWTLLKDGIAIAGGSKSLDALLAEALNRREA